MSGTELERAADRLVGEPALMAPSVDGITGRADQRRRRRRGMFGGGVMAAAIAVGAVVAVQDDDSVPVVATSGLATADGVAQDDGSAGASAPTEADTADERPGADGSQGDEKPQDDKESGHKPHWFGGEIDVTIQHQPFDQARADELAAAAEETIELAAGTEHEATAYIVRSDDRVSIAVVSTEHIVEIEAPASLVPDEESLRKLVERGEGGGFQFFIGDPFSGDELPKWFLDEPKLPFDFELPPADASPDELRQWMQERFEKLRSDLPLPEGFKGLEDFPFVLPPANATPEELEAWIEERFADLDLDLGLDWDEKGHWKLDLDGWGGDEGAADTTST